MNGKRILGWGAVVLIIFFVVAQPSQAASLVHSIVDWLKESAGSVLAFIKGVINGRS